MADTVADVFLRRFDERDEPITSAEADMAGPWSVLPVPGLEAAGAVALERCGAILEERVFAAASEPGS